MKKIIFAFMFVVLCATSYAQQIVVMVMPFKVEENAVTKAEAATITRIFRGRLATQTSGVMTVLNIENVQARMDAMKWEMSDWSNNEKKARLNEGFNADYLLIGTISKLGDIIVDVVAEHGNTFTLVGNSDEHMRSINEAYAAIEPLVSNMVAVMTGARSVAPITRPGTTPEGFVRIEGGTFTMGSPESEVGRDSDEVQHQVSVSSFYMAKYEVTQKEWVAVMGSYYSNPKGDNLPVETITWYNAIEYCNKRSEKEGLRPAYTIDKSRFDPNNFSSTEKDTIRWVVTMNRNANGYRLPTEAEWEYACRAATTTTFNTGNNITTNQASYLDDKTTMPSWGSIYTVGHFSPNRWGLYDMHGNVWEWCWDWYGDYSTGAQTDPMGAASGSGRVLRGGGFHSSAEHLRSAARDSDNPSWSSHDCGFRVVRP